MKHLILTTIVLANFFNLFSQKLSSIYGKVGFDDIEYNTCEFDKTADAVVMFDNGKSSFVDRDNEGFKIIFERTTRIKILTDAGVKWANIEIPFYYTNQIFENIYEFEASAYNFENGKLNIVKFDPKDSHDEKIDENWMVKKIAIPNVKKGSIIEYSYKIITPYIFNLRDWEFQWEIPVLNSKYIVELIPFYVYRFILQGANSFDEYSSVVENYDRQYGSIKYKNMIHTYGMKNIKAFVDEEYITSKNDYLMKLNFQLSKIIQPDGYEKDVITSWQKLSDDLLVNDDFGKYIEKSKKLAPKILNPSLLTSMSSKDKYDSVLNYVKRNFRWDNKSRMYASKKPTDLLKDKYGNSADLNLFAIGLLKSLNIEAYPIILSTRNHGKIKMDYPFHDFFNYTLIGSKIDSTIYLSDATEILLENKNIPVSCINDKGLIIQKKKVEWINLKPRLSTKTKTNLIINLEDSINNTQIIVKSSEYNGLYFRKKYGENIKEIQKYLLENGYQVEDSNIIVKNYSDISNPYIINLKFNYHPEEINNKIYVAPFLNEVMKNNPLKQNDRNYHIDMIYPELKSYSSTIKIPKGYKVYAMPGNQKIKNDKFELEFYTTTTNEFVTISLSYFFLKSEYPANEYLDLKFYFNEIIKRAQEKLVLIKE